MTKNYLKNSTREKSIKSFLSLFISAGMSLSLANSQVRAMEDKEIPINITIKYNNNFYKVRPDDTTLFIQETKSNHNHELVDEIVFTKNVQPFGDKNGVIDVKENTQFNYQFKFPEKYKLYNKNDIVVGFYFTLYFCNKPHTLRSTYKKKIFSITKQLNLTLNCTNKVFSLIPVASNIKFAWIEEIIDSK